MHMAGIVVIAAAGNDGKMTTVMYISRHRGHCNLRGGVDVNGNLWDGSSIEITTVGFGLQCYLEIALMKSQRLLLRAKVQ